RLVRELSQKTGKKIRLETIGETTEIDKTVIEQLSDPLTHMIRNSADHGIEAVERRLAAGKSETGVVGADEQLSDEQIDQLIFAPGFSTAEAVSDLSGRGVGMDVVLSNIRKIGGSVHVRSWTGRGT